MTATRSRKSSGAPKSMLVQLEEFVDSFGDRADQVRAFIAGSLMAKSDVLSLEEALSTAEPFKVPTHGIAFRNVLLMRLCNKAGYTILQETMSDARRYFPC